mmetsp:Transcript_39284/g.63727  ORF Transcript_39284/g.63727 Transcript_39284/m.63727 type:complete len:206 (-) Transcript_39284:574-1191(-)
MHTGSKRRHHAGWSPFRRVHSAVRGVWSWRSPRSRSHVSHWPTISAPMRIRHSHWTIASPMWRIRPSHWSAHLHVTVRRHALLLHRFLLVRSLSRGARWHLLLPRLHPHWSTPRWPRWHPRSRPWPSHWRLTRTHPHRGPTRGSPGGSTHALGAGAPGAAGRGRHALTASIEVLHLVHPLRGLEIHHHLAAVEVSSMNLIFGLGC